MASICLCYSHPPQGTWMPHGLWPSTVFTLSTLGWHRFTTLKVGNRFGIEGMALTPRTICLFVCGFSTYLWVWHNLDTNRQNAWQQLSPHYTIMDTSTTTKRLRPHRIQQQRTFQTQGSLHKLITSTNSIIYILIISWPRDTNYWTVYSIVHLHENPLHSLPDFHTDSTTYNGDDRTTISCNIRLTVNTPGAKNKWSNRTDMV